jgi:cation transport regulator ChaC
MKLIESGNWNVYRLLKYNQAINYFAYGSCMDNEHFQKARVSHFFPNVKGHGLLDGYQLRFTRRSHDGGRADVVEKEVLQKVKSLKFH